MSKSEFDSTGGFTGISMVGFIERAHQIIQKFILTTKKSLPAQPNTDNEEYSGGIRGTNGKSSILTDGIGGLLKHDATVVGKPIGKRPMENGSWCFAENHVRKEPPSSVPTGQKMSACLSEWSFH